MILERPNFVRLEDFLDNDSHQRVLDFARNCREFEAAQVSRDETPTGKVEPSVWRAQLASVDEDILDIFNAKLRALLPHMRLEIGVPRFELGEIEVWLAAHKEGDFFSAHQDLTYDDLERRLTFTYYFEDPATRFDGGELRLYDHEISADDELSPVDTYQDVEPIDNSIAFFAPWAHHEVQPVRNRSEGEPGIRYSITGFFRDAEPTALAQLGLSPEQQNELAATYMPNFTPQGFELALLPASMYLRLREFVDQGIGSAGPEFEADEDIYLDGHPDFLALDPQLADDVIAELKPMHERWAGVPLEESAIYGVRVYRDGHRLLPHVDRIETHVISSVVHLMHDTDTPWHLRIVDVDGDSHDVALEEGEMVFYESARSVHSRPEPMVGRSYCSIFVHYRPVDWNMSWAMLVAQAEADGRDDLLPGGSVSTEP
ncbi:MAG: 2OG-Fe(II) oxygenase [Actinomycetia bacterium]|nr:2OG-Fe(II) oxygenase [Actinomycetes bacterium]